MSVSTVEQRAAAIGQQATLEGEQGAGPPRPRLRKSLDPECGRPGQTLREPARHADTPSVDQKFPGHSRAGLGASQPSPLLSNRSRRFHEIDDPRSFASRLPSAMESPFDDADFYQCVPTNAIKIEVVLGDIIDTFRDLESYGHWLSGWDATELRRRTEPGEGREDALRIRLEVGEDLEPSWRVIKNDDDEGISFKAPDRGKVAVSLIGAFSDRHLTWSRGSLLGNLTDADNLSLSLAEASRAARTALEGRRAESLASFDIVAGTAEVTARSLGVNVSSSYKAHLDSEAISIHVGGLALHDGEMPLRQLGLGSKRMLATGLQKQALRTGHITLFDEVEIGLEPHRIARLVEHLKRHEWAVFPHDAFSGRSA
jgi:AAA domain, putative AbiEii toxin, Type IV TA system